MFILFHSSFVYRFSNCGCGFCCMAVRKTLTNFCLQMWYTGCSEMYQRWLLHFTEVRSVWEMTNLVISFTSPGACLFNYLALTVFIQQAVWWLCSWAGKTNSPLTSNLFFHLMSQIVRVCPCSWTLRHTDGSYTFNVHT